MGISGRWALVLVCVSLSFGSFADEAAQVAFALRLADQTSSVSILLAAGLIGGMLAGPITPAILHRIGPPRTISAAIFLQSLLIAGASLANQFWAYVGFAMVLGSLGTLLWSAIMAAIPGYASDDRDIDRANRIVQSMRNAGFVGGPALGGLLYGMADPSHGLWLLSLLVLIAALAIMPGFKALNSRRRISSPEPAHDKPRGSLDLPGLFRTTGVIRAITPLLMTVLLTSSLNVLLIFRIRTELQFGAEIYGLVVSALSVGLIAGPICFSGVFARLGDAPGASMAAGIIGVGILWLALSDKAWTITCAAFLIGSANGIQNALTASFMMKATDPQRRFNLMPAYLFSIQASVFLGFLSAGMISAVHVNAALMTIGVVTGIIGTCGFVLNVKNRPRMARKERHILRDGQDGVKSAPSEGGPPRSDDVA